MKENPDQLTFGFVDTDEIIELRKKINQLQAENDQLRSELALLKNENRQLKEKTITGLDESTDKLESNAGLTESVTVVESEVTRQSPIQDKVRLYRQYFKGRDDVYATRKVDGTGKSVYYPTRHYIGKENGKAIWGDHLPLTDEVIQHHLQREDPPVTVCCIHYY